MKNLQYIIALFFCSTLFFQNVAQETPAPVQNKSVLIINGTAHLGTGEKINRSAIVLENGKITLVKNALTTTIDFNKYDTIIDAKDKHVYPGFIAPNTSLGLAEMEAVRASNDYREVGLFKPHVRSLISYNTDSEITPTVRTNGVLMGQITPRGGVISGNSSIVHFDAWNWEDAVVLMDDGIHLNWPKTFNSNRWSSKPGPAAKSKNYETKVEEITTFIKEAQAYAKGSSKVKNLRFEAMKGVFSGEKTLFIRANYIKEISAVINFKKAFSIPKVVIIGGYDSWMEAARLKENNIAVILRRTHSLPEREADAIDLPYKLPKILHDAGVSYCLQYTGDMEQMGTRNLPFVAGTAAAYGLEYEQAVMAVSINTAKILGIDKDYGSIEEGKSATLFVSEGDALDMRTNDVTVAFIDGRMINLNNHQKRNYEKYKRKYKVE